MVEKLRLENISLVRSHEGKPVNILSDVSGVIYSRDIYTILGPSGSGKSTLLRLINRLSDPTSGTILLDEQNAHTLNVLKLRQRVGMIFQAPVVFDGSVLQNLEYAAQLAEKQIEPDVLLRRVGLNSEFLSRNAASLSGGEQQRLAIARTLATDPELLLMDEPTSALDPTSRGQIEDLVRKMNRDEGLTILFVTHDMQQAHQIGTRTMLLVGGKKIEEAPTEEFFENPKTETAQLFLQGRLSI